MSTRIGIIALQAIGALSIVPYPAILVANVMSIAAEGQTWRGALPFVLLSLYPLVWMVLDKLAWTCLNGGQASWAFALSSVPVILSLTGLVWGYFFLGTK